MSAGKAWVCVALAAMCSAASTAQGAVVHRCKSADGAIVFRDAPCAIGETTVDRREFVDPVTTATPSSSTREAHRAGSRDVDADALRDTPAWRTPRLAQARAGPTGSPARADRIVAHECRFGEQRWVQAAACPRSLTLATGHSGKATRQSVDETRLTASQVCSALRGISSADAPGEGSARRAYGMNRLRQQHGC